MEKSKAAHGLPPVDSINIPDPRDRAIDVLKRYIGMRRWLSSFYERFGHELLVTRVKSVPRSLSCGLDVHVSNEQNITISVKPNVESIPFTLLTMERISDLGTVLSWTPSGKTMAIYMKEDGSTWYRDRDNYAYMGVETNPDVSGIKSEVAGHTRVLNDYRKEFSRIGTELSRFNAVSRLVHREGWNILCTDRDKIERKINVLVETIRNKTQRMQSMEKMAGIARGWCNVQIPPMVITTFDETIDAIIDDINSTLDGIRGSTKRPALETMVESLDAQFVAWGTKEGKMPGNK